MKKGRGGRKTVLSIHFHFSCLIREEKEKCMKLYFFFILPNSIFAKNERNTYST